MKPTTIPWTPLEIQKALAERSLWEFVKLAWPVIEPEALVPGWHIKTVCDHLQAISEGKIRNLIVNIPPRHTKSLITSVMWNAWEWGPFNHPQTRWLCMSYSSGLSIRDSVKARTLMQSNWYRALWGDRFGLMGDVNARERYANNRNGQRVSSSVGGMATGEGGDRIVVDDPHNIKEIHSESSRNEVIYWWDTVMPTRSNNPKKSSKVIIMQRSHENDLVGHIKANGTGRDYEWLVLPAEFEPKARCKTSLFTDPRTEEGELLWPERFNKESLESLRTESLGSYGYAAQFQQRPAPAEGGIVKRHWWQWYNTMPEVDAIFQIWDMAFKDLKTSSYVCGQVWGVKFPNFYLLDEVREKLDFVKTVQAVRRLTFKWPKAEYKFVEDKANGPAVISTLKNEIPGLIGIPAKESKESRMFSVSPYIESGNAWLPSPLLCPWINDWVEELSMFPNAAYNDRADCCSHALMQGRKRFGAMSSIAPIDSMTRTSAWTSVGA